MNKLNLELEFYKLIKTEYNQYLTYVENLWKLKLIAIGSIISFAILNEKILEAITNTESQLINIDLVAIGVLAIPLLAFIIDLKVLETGLHLKSISNFIEDNLDEFDIAKRWENSNWKSSFYKTNRKFILFLSTVGISFLILFLSLLIVSKYLKPEWLIYCIGIGILLSVIGVVIVIIISRKLFR